MITYLVNFILCSGLLLLIYRAFLGNENLYRFNRFYLLFSLVFSLAVPFITIKIIAAQTPALGRQIIERSVLTVINSPVNQHILRASQHSNYLPNILLALYTAVTIILLVRFIGNLYYIKQSISRNPVIPLKDIKLVLLDKEITPHSFLKYVFLNKDHYHNALIEPEIICHEQAHVRQLHSLDVLLIEVFQVIGWFNPFILFYRRAIQLNHEFLADEAVIQHYNNTTGYQYLLLAKASQNNSLYLTSQFNYSATKKRLMMMTINTSAKIAMYKRLAVVPVLAGALLLFSHKDMAKNASAVVKNVYKNIAGAVAKINLVNKEITSEKRHSVIHFATAKTKQGSSSSETVIPDTDYNNTPVIQNASLADSSKYKTQQPLKKMEGFAVMADGTLTKNGQVIPKTIPDSIPVYVNGVLTHYMNRVSADKVKIISIERPKGSGNVEKMRVYISRMEITNKPGPDSAKKKIINLVTRPVD